MTTTLITIRKSRIREGWRYGLYRGDVLIEHGFIAWADADRARDEWLLQEQLHADGHGTTLSDITKR